MSSYVVGMERSAVVDLVGEVVTGYENVSIKLTVYGHRLRDFNIWEAVCKFALANIFTAREERCVAQGR